MAKWPDTYPFFKLEEPVKVDESALLRRLQVPDEPVDVILDTDTYNEIDHVLSTWVGLSPNIRSKYGSDGMTDSTKNTVFDVENEDAKQRRIELCKKSGKEFIPTLGDMYGVDSVRKVCMRSWNSEFKRKNLEMCIDINNGVVLMH